MGQSACPVKQRTIENINFCASRWGLGISIDKYVAQYCDKKLFFVLKSLKL